jgi:hypothetical protein
VPGRDGESEETLPRFRNEESGRVSPSTVKGT